MEINFKQINPNKKAIDYELLLTFVVTIPETASIPVDFRGELYSEDGYKLGDMLRVSNENHAALWLNATGSTRDKKNYRFEITFNCRLSEKAIQHVENYRLSRKEKTKDVVFIASLQVSSLEGNIELAHIHIATNSGPVENSLQLFYRYVQDFNASPTNMWILSAAGGANYIGSKVYHYPAINVQIDMMDWINNFAPYLDIGNFIVFEFLQPDRQVFAEDLAKRYEKAQEALTAMRQQLAYGEWKQAIICCRPIFELFKNFAAFKKLLIDSGYTEGAYVQLNNSIQGFFGLLSKFYHALEQSPANVNDDIPAQKEDAYMVYSYSVSLLNLVCSKLRRIN
jgi:hypothetical protein